MKTRPHFADLPPHLAVLLLIVLCSLPSLAAPPTARGLPTLMPAPEFVLQHAQEIGLTPEQRTRIESATDALQPAAQQSSALVRQESNALAQLLAREKVDGALVSAQFEKVLAA